MKKITYIQLLLLHVGMAFVIYLFEGASKFFLFGAILYFMYRILSNNNRKDEVLLAAGYITGFEVLSRMTGGAFSYEFAKYAVIGLLLLGMFIKGANRSSWPYFIYIFLLLPGILFSAINLNYDTTFTNAIAFNLSGPICLGISALYCFQRKIPLQRLQEILLAILLPIVATTAYLYFFTPSIQDSLSGTSSNYAASGGYGPNQVSTILGLGMFILFTRLLTIQHKLINVIDLTLLGFLSYRAFVTFSRGGVITAAICAVVFLVIYSMRSKNRRSEISPFRVLIIFGVIAVTWFTVSIFTSGLIVNRYSNQDAAGRLKETISSGRTEILQTELSTFYRNPIFGVGVGKAKEVREDNTGISIATHNELSRLLSEHGIFGIIALLVLFLMPLSLRFRNKSNPYFYVFLLFWFITINHSSMRIAAPAFMYGLALLYVLPERVKKQVQPSIS